MSEDREENIVIAKGTSMFPLIRDGMRVTLRKVEPGEIAVGDIVAFPGDGVTVLHRIIRQRGDKWLEKGDNRRTGTWIDAASCTGKALLCQQAGAARRLDVSPHALRLKLIVFFSQIEQAVFGLGLRTTRLVWPPNSSRVPARISSFTSFLTAPLRVLIGAPLLTVYPAVVQEESAGQLARLVDFFRGVAGPIDDGLAGLLASHGLDSFAVVDDGIDKSARYRSAFLFMNVMATLGDVHRALSSRGIRYAILKGPPLADALYGEGFLRTSTDIDVLVAPDDRDRAAEALAQSGFRARGSKLQQAAVKRGHFHLVFDALEKGRSMVELHWALVDRANLYRIDDAEIRARWTTARVNNLDIGVLSREDEFLYLLLHIAKHGLFNGFGVRSGQPATWFCRSITGNRLIWFLDVQRLLEKFGASMDWSALRENSNRWNISEEIFQSLEILNRLKPNAEAAAALKRLAFENICGGRTASGRSDIPRWVMRWMKANKNLIIRPARLLMLRQLLFPGREKLRGFYRGSRTPWSVLAIVHPFRMMARLIWG